MDAVKFCMPHIDAEVMEKLVPRLVDIIKSGIGVSTKVRGSLVPRPIRLAWMGLSTRLGERMRAEDRRIIVSSPARFRLPFY